MTVPGIIIISLSMSLTRPTATAPAEAAGPGVTRRLPHPDILVLPPPSDRPASSGQSDNLTGSTPVQAAAAPVTTNSPEDDEGREIPRRNRPTVDVQKTGGPESQAVARRVSRSQSWSLIDLWPLVVVLLLIAVMVVILKRAVPARRFLSGSGILQVVARTHVSPKQQILLVRLGRRLILVGVSPERIGTLTIVDDPEQVALLLGEAASAAPRSMNREFRESMREQADAYAREPEEDISAVTRGHVHGLLEKVRGLAGKSV